MGFVFFQYIHFMQAKGLWILFLLTPFSVRSQVSVGELSKSIFFRGGSYYIDEQQENNLARWLDSIPNLLEKYQVQIISHTDNIGSRRYNQWLSQMRSQMVFQVLLQKDIPEKIIHVRDWGYENPVFSNDSFGGQRMNRRVDVVLHPIVF
ncbi:MAG: OmpA family protein [Bacteroidetes bacterium]|nr:OmpA family protein [Bacteroidota bacterium]